MANISTVRFKNRIGDFIIVNEENSWILQKPRIIPAKTRTIEKIINSLKQLNIYTIHQYEPINFQSFSLDNPLLEIDVYSKLDEKMSVKVGLINPINNTSYITVSGHDKIFQTTLLKGQLEKLELSDFIDSNIFSIKIDQIKSLSIYRGSTKQAHNRLSKDVNNFWNSKKYKMITNERVSLKIEKILGIKSHMIIDQQNAQLNTFIGNYIKYPQFRILIKTKNNKEISYKVSSPIKEFPELKLEKKQYFIMTASDRPYPYIVNKSYLDEFIVRYSQIK